MENRELIPHLFRTEYSKIAAVLCKHLGMAHVSDAEDIASETFKAALETWPFKGIPENPKAWLYAVAKNKARNLQKRKTVFSETIAPHLKNSPGENDLSDIDLSDKNITDSQLQMLFAICHPVISREAQIALALRILCGFGVDEIADAFLTNKATINKRLFRAREKLRRGPVTIEFPARHEIEERLDAVTATLYLLFSEGYYSQSKNTQVRKDLCLEAMRLTYLLVENDATSNHSTNALLALMCFHSSRLDARQDQNGAIILYQDQDEQMWNTELMLKGNYYLQQASKWPVLSRYFLEAGIAYWHTIKEDSRDKWENILHLYNHLLQLEYSPMAALNRTYALSRVAGNESALREALKLDLRKDHFYYLLLGELYTSIDRDKAIDHYSRAAELARTESEKANIRLKIAQCGE